MNKDYILQRIRALSHPMTPISVGTKPQLRQLKNIKCIAFDFYGTMFISAVGDIGIDEEQQQSNAGYFTEALHKIGFPPLQSEAGKRGIEVFEEAIRAHIETPKRNGVDYPEPLIEAVWRDVLNELVREKFIEGDISEEKAKHFGIEFEFRVNDVWPLTGLKTVLNKLLSRNLTLGIISNSQFYTPLTFEAMMGSSPRNFGFDPDLMIWSYIMGRKKPSVDFYRLFIEAAEKKRLKPSEVLYVGNDIRKDIQPAKEVGLKTALYVGDRRSIRHEKDELDLPEFKADLIIDDLNQILKCV